ncbi:Uncharacterised protein [Nocardiopsis dassonvillei]|uniref:Uncharacterized protein n=2 Tax=Nocardiopsis dassonvillei TaxID=2014 RepID=D7B2M9_NOCDD|nr:hypothetical protein Ndas_1289 [Nocardiopsis dassonvillei subsp. dassonvillei DSM 43111]VEI92750.1 Uncharacterised protein [Nocardiopsis dassonvillei]
MTVRGVMRKHGVSPTVTKALASARPEPGKKLPPRPSRLDACKPLIDAMPRAVLDALREQRHTCTRVFGPAPAPPDWNRRNGT